MAVGWWLVVVLLAVLNMVDAVLTWLGVRSGFVEGNPVSASLVGDTVLWFLVKGSLSLWLLLAAWFLRGVDVWKVWSRFFVSGATFIYVGVVVWNMAVLV